MSVEAVKNFFDEKKVSHSIILLEESSATVSLAAAALGISEMQIAKTLALNVNEESIVIVTCGIAKIDNRKFKDTFHTKAKMMSFEETLEKTGHPVGGVCPFGLPKEVKIYLDESIKELEEVYPAAGSPHSVTKISVSELEKITEGKWIDVCKV